MCAKSGFVPAELGSGYGFFLQSQGFDHLGSTLIASDNDGPRLYSNDTL
jgi:hypothetical protein